MFNKKTLMSYVPRFRTAPVIFLIFLGPVLLYLGFFPDIYVPIWDKLLRFIGFLLMAVANYFVLLDVTWRENLLIVTLGSLLCSFGSEFVQLILPYREFEWLDILANLLGSAMGIVLAMGGEECLRRRRLRREARYGHLVEEGDWMATLMDDEEEGSGDVDGMEMYRRDILDDIEEEFATDDDEGIEEVVIDDGEGKGDKESSRILASKGA